MVVIIAYSTKLNFAKIRSLFFSIVLIDLMVNFLNLNQSRPGPDQGHTFSLRPDFFQTGLGSIHFRQFHEIRPNIWSQETF